MSDARNTGGRDGGRAGWSGRKRQRPRRDYSEYWLERMVGGLYQATVEEPVPQALLDIVERIPLSQPAIHRALRRAGRLRAKAKAVRKTADSMTNDSIRNTLLQMAQSYDALADDTEKDARQPGGDPTRADRETRGR